MSNEDRIMMIPVERIHVINPRSRGAKRYRSITRSITNLGLKTPIVVSPRRSDGGDDEMEYELVCGQGRLEAFRAAGEEQIPARIIDVPKDDLLLMGLIENIARRQAKRSELTGEILRLEKLGYNTYQISQKIDCNFDFVQGVIKLHRAGEERLLEAVMNDRVSIVAANLIADATSNTEAQDAIMQAYENKEIQTRGLATVKRLLDQREYLGKSLRRTHSKKRPANRGSIVAAYRREMEKQKQMVKKARICEARLVFIAEAFKRLKQDENFMTLLRAENIDSLPEPLKNLGNSKNDKG